MREKGIKRMAAALVVALIVMAGLFLIDSAWRLSLPAESKEMEGAEMEMTDILTDPKDIKEIYLAGGCFWGVEAYMARIDGVVDAVSGYANGKTENPSYEDLIYRNSGHAETVKVLYDPKRISLDELLIYYFRIIDPTSINRQGNDIGVQYRTGIYYKDPADLPVIRDRIKEIQKGYDLSSSSTPRNTTRTTWTRTRPDTAT